MADFLFLPRPLAEKYLPPDNSVIISFYDAAEGQASFLGSWVDILRIEAHDIDVPRPGHILFNEVHAKQVLDFLEKYKTCQQVVVHCTMGQSRSAAVALFAAEHYEAPCFKVKMPVTWRNWPGYNKHIYSTLRKVAHDRVSATPKPSYSELFAQLSSEG